MRCHKGRSASRGSDPAADRERNRRVSMDIAISASRLIDYSIRAAQAALRGGAPDRKARRRYRRERGLGKPPARGRREDLRMTAWVRIGTVLGAALLASGCVQIQG